MDKTGGSAFPRENKIIDANDKFFKLGHPVMTLRDWFSGQALNGYLAYTDKWQPEDIAKMCYLYADAMIDQRNKNA